jgi:glycosyltransferase involved in cell wall biosynthesis
MNQGWLRQLRDDFARESPTESGLATAGVLPEHGSQVPRVLITGFCAVPGPTRAGVQLRHVVRALTPLHNVDVLAVREGDQAYVERQGSVRILRVPTHDQGLRVQVQAFQRALRRQLDGADYDVVHCRDGWSGIPVLEARDRLGYAVVFDLTRSPARDDGGPDPGLEADQARDEEACLLGADLVLVPHEQARRHAASRGRPDRIFLAPPGVDVDRFDWDDVPPGGPPRILYTGSLEPGRGVRVLVRAMVDIAKQSDAQLVLAGPCAPGFEPQLRSAVIDLGIADRVQILGSVDHEQLPTLIATATVCVAPHAVELAPRPYALYPTKLLEYLACRRAVVAPRRGTVGMVIENGRDGVMFEPGDPLDLARKLLDLLEDAGTRDRIAHAGYQRVRREFTASAARRALRAAYAELAKRFHDRFAEGAAAIADADERPAEPIADDDFEATVFEEVPSVPDAVHVTSADDTGLETGVAPPIAAIDAAIASLDRDRGDAIADPPTPRIELAAAIRPRAPRAALEVGDETVERAPIEPSPGRRGETEGSDDSGAWTAAVQAVSDDWVVAAVAEARGMSEEEGEGTPLEGLIPPPPPVRRGGPEHAFVAGEIDVPTPPPEALADVGEFTAASALLSGREDAAPDTGEHNR